MEVKVKDKRGLVEIKNGDEVIWIDLVRREVVMEVGEEEIEGVIVKFEKLWEVGWRYWLG